MSRMKKIEDKLIKIGQTAVDGIANALEYTDSLLDKGRKASPKKKKTTKAKATKPKATQKKGAAKSAGKSKAAKKAPAKKSKSSTGNKSKKAARKK